MEDFNEFMDEDLFGLLQQGNRSAYAEIYHRYKGPLFVFAYRRLGNRTEAEDVTSDLFLSLWSSHEQLSLNSSVAAYLFRSSRNMIYRLVSRKKLQSRYLDSFESYVEEQEGDTDFLVRNKEFAAIIQKEVDELPEKMREVFLLSRETFLSRSEIAMRLGISEETVKSQMHKALKVLKAKLGSVFFMVFL
jgi:RNA polymerase sigma-70 factor (family 1)